MPWFAIMGLVCFVVGFAALWALVMATWHENAAERRPTPSERPSRTVRVIRDPRFGLERWDDEGDYQRPMHQHRDPNGFDWRGDDE